MAKISFIGTWAELTDMKNSRGLLGIWVDPDYRPLVKNALLKLHSKEKKKGQKYKLEVSLEVWYKKRTSGKFSQNNLGFALCNILANEHNHGEQRADSLTEYEVYKEMEMLNSKHPAWPRKIGLSGFEVAKPAKELNTRAFAELMIEPLFREISYRGVEIHEPDEIKKYWLDYKQHLNDEKIILYDQEEITGKAYKELNPICEASGVYIGDGGGELAHIKARGMGGNPEDEKDRPSNWLHLSNDAHSFWHNRGVEEFKKAYSHLRHKIEMALGEK